MLTNTILELNLRTDSLKKSVAFWTQLGFEQIEDIPEEMAATAAVLSNGSIVLTLQTDMDIDIAFQITTTDGVAETVKELAQGGARVLNEPEMNEEEVLTAMVISPEGQAVHLIQPPESFFEDEGDDEEDEA